MQESKHSPSNPKSYYPNDYDRFIPEAISLKRTPFEKDRARILHSSALRRLEGKTQIFVAGENDFSRTRLTHTLEVAQIGRQLAINLGLDADLVDAACLAHDLGHPPFGHVGERVLNNLSADIGGFEGNAQTFRVLTRLEPKSQCGLNLTRATLNATIKYPWGVGKTPADKPSDLRNKFNVYADDLEIYHWVRQDFKGNKVLQKSLEATVMDFSDDIAYCVNDIEDGLVQNVLDFATLKRPETIDRILDMNEKHFCGHKDALLAGFKALKTDGFLNYHYSGTYQSLADLKSLTSGLIGRYVRMIDLKNHKIIIDPNAKNELSFLKAFALTFLWHWDPNVDVIAEKIITKLMNELMKDYPHRSNLLSEQYGQMWDNCKSKAEAKRIAIDQIASLTDFSAKKLANC